MATRKGRSTRRLRNSALETSLLNAEERAVLHALDATLTPDSIVLHQPSRSKQCIKQCGVALCDKSAISLLFMLAVFAAGITLLGVSYAPSLDMPQETQMILRTVAVFFVSAGLFGVAGGGSSLLALLMLFYEIPLLFGTGVIPRQHEQILELLRTIVLQLLFDSRHLENYIQERINRFSVEVNIVDCITRALNSSASEHIINTQLNTLYSQPEACYLGALGISKERLKPMIKPAVLSLCAESAPLVLGKVAEQDSNGSSPAISVPKIRRAMNQYLQQRAVGLTKQRIRSLMKSLVFQKLGWLVVLASILGLCIGLIAQALRIGFAQIGS